MKVLDKALALGIAAAMAGALFVSAPAANATDTPAAVTAADTTGRTVDFDAGWKFVKGNPSGAQNADFDDSGWQNIDLPHDWRIYEDFTGVGSSKAAAKAARGYLPYGAVWYRKTFSLTETMKGKHIVINFDGVQSSSALYVNGKAVGVKSTDGYTQLVGYGPYSEDITEYLNQDGANVIAVKAVVSEPTSRWYEGGGIYRDVTLSVTDAVHVGLYGTDITAPIPTAATYNDGDNANDFSYGKDEVLNYIAGGTSQLDIATDVDNDDNKDIKATVRTDILDGTTTVASVTAEPIAIKAGETATVKQTAVITNPKLWSPDTPNLYTAKTTVAVDGTTVDEYETTIGVRYLTYTANDGFYLNGQYTKLKGMCLHSDLGALGMAFNERAAARQIEILKDAGVNAIRTAHNPAARKFIELANRMGVMVLEEVGEEWTGPKMGGKGLGTAAQKTVTGDNEWAGKIWLEKELKTMVDRDKNDPSVIMWSIGNEITASQLGEVASTTGQYKDLDENLVKWTKEVDATRPTTMNNYREMGAAQTVLDNVDVAGYSYLGGRVMSEWHKAHPDWINLASESGSHLESRGKYYNLEDPVMGEIKSVRDDNALQLSAYDAYQNGKEVDLTWNQEIDADYSLGEFNWTGFDYIGEPTPYAGDSSTDAKGNTIASKSSYFGIVDTAGLPKDSYYLYKSLWTDRAPDPMVHLVPSNWNWEEGQKIDVQAYSNAMSVELFLNGKSLGVRSFDEQATRLGLTYRTATDRNTIAVDDSKDRNDFYLTWDNVAYEPGELKAVAYSEADGKGDVIAEDVLNTSGETAALKLTPDRRLIDNDGYSGTDLSFITVEATDLNGTLVPDADNTVTFSVQNGYIAGVDNGDGASLEKWQTATGDYTTSYRSLFSGKAMLIVRSDGSGKPIEVTAQSTGLTDGTATVYTVKGNADTITELVSERRSTNVGVNPSAVLPATVTAVYGDGHTAQLPVVWRAIDSSEYAKVGVVNVEGVVEGTSLKAALTLSVNGIIAVQPVTGAINAGTDVAEVLPETVNVVYSDGAKSAVDVTWNADEVAQATEAAKKTGTVKVTGAISAETDVKATAMLRVVEPDAEATPNTTATLKDLKVKQNDGQATTIDGFASDKTSYALTLPWNVKSFTLEPETADNAGVYVVPPMGGVAGLYKVVVTSEDGKTVQTYSVNVQLEQAPLGSVKAELAGVAIDNSGVYAMKDGESAGISATALGKNDMAIIAGVTFAYASSNDFVASVDSTGTLVANGKGSTTITVTASVKNETASTVFTVTVTDSGRTITAIEPVKVTVMKGAAKVAMPDSVKVTYATGPEGKKAVTWSAASLAGINVSAIGTAKVTGTVNGTSLPAEATVTVHDVAAVENIATATPVGALPALPETAVIYYTDGTDTEQAVAWNPIDAAAVANIGFAEATGTVTFEEDGVTITREVKARIRVGEEKTGENRILYQTNAFPQVSSTPASSAESVGQVNDGIISFARNSGKNRWTTYHLDNGTTPKDAKLNFILGLANETAYDFNKLRVYWYKYSSDGPADTLTIKYRNAEGAMVPVANQQAANVEYDTDGRGQVVDYTFDNVNTSRFELDMHKTSGAIAITEIEAFERGVATNTVTTLTGLKAGGVALDEFAPNVSDYTVAMTGAEYPSIEPEYDADANPGVTVVPASVTFPNVRVIVRSEDRESSATYTVAFQSQTPETNFSALQSAVDEAGSLQKNQYTADSWKPFAEALAAAKAVLGNAGSTQSEVNAALDALIGARDALVKVADKPDKPNQSGDGSDDGKSDSDGSGGSDDSSDAANKGESLTDTGANIAIVLLTCAVCAFVGAVFWLSARRDRQSCGRHC